MTFCVYQNEEGGSTLLIQHGQVMTDHVLFPILYPIKQRKLDRVEVSPPSLVANQNVRRVG